MTPEQAQELRRGDFGSSEWRQMVGNLEACYDSLGGPYIWGTPGDFALVEAAPALAEMVAGLRYEYLFQVNDREWVRVNDEGRFVLTGDPMRALRHYHPGVAAAIAKGASATFSCECRVVRRLVGEPEVAE